MPRYNRPTDLGPIIQDHERRLKQLEFPYFGDRGLTTLSGGTSGVFACPLATPTSLVQCTYSGAPSNPGYLYATPAAGNLEIHSTASTTGDVVWQIIG